MDILVLVILFVAGACLGSFAGATVWRLRARQLEEDKAAGEKIDAKEYKRLKPLLGKSGRHDRSIDLDTGKQLPWYDMIPVVSWLVLRGRSRFSGKPIGKTELLLELGVGLFFVALYVFWPMPLDTWYSIAQLSLWLVAGVLFAILFVYDAKWSLLPSPATTPLVVAGAAYTAVSVVAAPDALQAVLSASAGVFILSGLYLFLWVVSRRRWIGFGDVVLGLGLALLLGRWELAFMTLFLANVIGCLYVLPGLLVKRLTYTSRIPFGPFLIIGAIIALLWGDILIVNGSELLDSLTYRLWYN